MRIVTCVQGSPEWHAARAGMATASNFADVLSRSRDGKGEGTMRRNYRVRLVVARLTGRALSPGFQTAAMQQGNEREPMARLAYEAHTGNVVHEVGFMLDDTHQAGASPDGLIDDDGGLEIKCPELATHLEYLRRADEPPEYRAQIQGNLWLSGRAWWDFVSFNPDFPEHLQLVVRRVKRDEAYITQLQLAVALFMHEVREEEAALRKMPAAA
jgi:hypothetical protein